MGADPGQRTQKLRQPIAETTATNEALADVGGVNIHAGAAIDGRDRRRLERLCRYVARPPVSQERLSLAPDHRRLTYSFKREWRDGSYAIVLEPLDLIARLAALIVLDGELRAPGQHFDLLGRCTPRWMSDYSWSHAYDRVVDVTAWDFDDITDPTPSGWSPDLNTFEP